jgi:translation initiation factor 1 (eIF-1/SUI1)
MKKLNITKEQFNRSNYFQRKYGKLEYMSESGRLFKTNKGKVLKFNESEGSFFGIPGVVERHDTIIYNGCKIEPDSFWGDLGELYDQEHPEDEGHHGFDDWCWKNSDLIKSLLDDETRNVDDVDDFGNPVMEGADDQEKEFSYKGVVITRYDYESLPMPMAASKLDDETMQKIAEDIYYMLLDHGWEDKDIDRYLGRNLDELEDENDRDANMIKEDFWEYMENAAVANGMEYYSEMEDGDEYMESRKFGKKFKESDEWDDGIFKPSNELQKLYKQLKAKYEKGNIEIRLADMDFGKFWLVVEVPEDDVKTLDKMEKILKSKCEGNENWEVFREEHLYGDVSKVVIQEEIPDEDKDDEERPVSEPKPPFMGIKGTQDHGSFIMYRNAAIEKDELF